MGAVGCRRGKYLFDSTVNRAADDLLSPSPINTLEIPR
jgi:hypothetical protein